MYYRKSFLNLHIQSQSSQIIQIGNGRLTSYQNIIQLKYPKGIIKEIIAYLCLACCNGVCGFVQGALRQEIEGVITNFLDLLGVRGVVAEVAGVISDAFCVLNVDLAFGVITLTASDFLRAGVCLDTDVLDFFDFFGSLKSSSGLA